MSGKKTCYYEILGVEKTATEKEIKLAYRRAALKWHPDKNADNEEEARKMFQLINEANETLSDPQERAWYDDHRDQVLGGDQEEGFGLNLSEYFSRSAFSDFDDSPRGFYTVFRDLFANIFANESEYRNGSLPMFGKSTTPHNEVNSFYLSWSNFATSHPFSYADEYKVERDYNRYQRRQIEAHNLDKRKDAKKKYNLEVRAVVDYVKRRDPRWAAYELEKKRQADAKAEEAERKKREKEERDAEKRKIYAEEAKKEAEERKAELKRAIQEARLTGQVFDADDLDADGVDSDDEGGVIVLCEVCKKVFKSKPQFDAHCKSKKHLQVVAELKKEFERQNRIAAKQAQKQKVVEPETESEEEEDGSEFDDSDVDASDLSGSEDESSSDEEEQPPAHLNKKQKKAWLEKKRKEQELKAKLGGGSSSSKNKKKDESESEVSDDEDVIEGGSASEDDEDALAKEVAAQLAALKMGGKPKAKGKAKAKGKPAPISPSSSEVETSSDEESGSGSDSDSGSGSEEDGSSSSEEDSSSDEDAIPVILPQGRRGPKVAAADDDDDWQSGGKKAKAKPKPKAKQAAKEPKTPVKEVEEEYNIIGAPTGGAQKKSKKAKKTQDEELPEWKCAVCQGVFETRNKLFTHIKEKNHVGLKSADGSIEAPQPRAAKKGARK